MDFKLSYEMKASADDVWWVVGERFDDLRWSSGITESSLEGELGVGAIRVCHFPPNQFSKTGMVKERLLSFDRKAKTLSYEVTESNGVMKSACNHWTIVPLGPKRCRVDMHAQVELQGIARWFSFFMGFMLKRMGTQTARELEAHVLQRQQRGELAKATP